MQLLSHLAGTIIRAVWEGIYSGMILLLIPANLVLAKIRAREVYKESVIHLSGMVHIPYYMVRVLRDFGMKADYMAMGTSPVWDAADYRVVYSKWPFIRALQEFTVFWKVLAKYEVIHSHFMLTLSKTGWELPLLKKMGRKIVIHYRGCEIRDRGKNMRLHPQCNICEECDYESQACSHPAVLRRRQLAEKYGDLFLVTTPDMKDFVPEAIHFPFFVAVPDAERLCGERQTAGWREEFKIVHATNHPGLEGTHYIERAVENLARKGHNIKFVFLKGVSHSEVLREYISADLAIGKMKMGYYANAQIESMFLGVPTVTYIRDEFLTADLKNSGFIITDLKNLEDVLEYYMGHPEQLVEKRKLARKSIAALHDNRALAGELIRLYRSLTHNA